jgi:glycerol-3-phosphate O-acyltransferase / dihydroxyacetone phosphate acyltransferase
MEFLRFKKGGSHDRTDLLPLKVGISILALGAMQKYKIPVHIVCCGLKYFNRHKFRSEVIVEFGRPYKVPDEYLQMYLEDKRHASQLLLNQIETVNHFSLCLYLYRECET